LHNIIIIFNYMDVFRLFNRAIAAVDSAISYGPADCGNKKCAEKDGLGMRIVFWTGKLKRDSE
jgi:hypothetical protein